MKAGNEINTLNPMGFTSKDAHVRVPKGLRCRRHPKYRGLRTPGVECEVCDKLFEKMSKKRLDTAKQIKDLKEEKERKYAKQSTGETEE